MSKDHRHLYAVERMGNYNGIIGYQVSAPAEPDIFGIFTIKDDDLIICDRAARLGYPTKFSADGGTLLLLRRYASTKTVQIDAPNHHPFGTFATSAAERPLVPMASDGR
jgi:hypothetical protein